MERMVHSTFFGSDCEHNNCCRDECTVGSWQCKEIYKYAHRPADVHTYTDTECADGLLDILHMCLNTHGHNQEVSYKVLGS